MKKTVLVAVIILALAVGVASYLNRGDLAAKQHSQQDAFIIVKSGGMEVARVDMEFIKGLEETEVEADLKRSGKEPEKHRYTGVLLRDVLDGIKADTVGKDAVVLKAVDGYTVAIDMNEVLDDDNVYLVYKIDGKPLGRKEKGGSGPYQVILAKDPFSQRWCKFVMEIQLQ